jgi:thioredoxin
MNTNKTVLELNQPVTVGDNSFATEVLNSDIPVLVDIWAEWCGPCRMIGPIVDSLAAQYAGKIKVAKVNSDTSPKICQEFVIRSIPTLLFFKRGVLVNRVVGAVSRTMLMEKLNALL